VRPRCTSIQTSLMCANSRTRDHWRLLLSRPM
jgi:hypothetical protein